MAPKHRPKHAAPSKFSLSARKAAPTPPPGNNGYSADAGRLRSKSDFAEQETLPPRRTEPEKPPVPPVEAPEPDLNGSHRLQASDFGRSAEDFWNESPRPRRRGDDLRKRDTSARTTVIEAPPADSPPVEEHPVHSRRSRRDQTAQLLTADPVDEPVPARKPAPAGEPPPPRKGAPIEEPLRGRRSFPLEDWERRRVPASGEPEPVEKRSSRKIRAEAVKATPNPAVPARDWREDAVDLEEEVRERPYARYKGTKVQEAPTMTSKTVYPPSARADRKARKAAKPHESQSLGQWFKEITILGIVAVGTAVLLTTYVVQAFFIPSGSMESTLLIGDRVLVNKFAYKFGEPVRDDIVVFTSPEGARAAPPANTPFAKFMDKVAIAIGLKSSEQDLIKRVIATEGQTIEGRLGLVFVDGQQLDETYRRTTDPIPDFPATKVPEGNVFVMGDNRLNSKDSREFGTIPMSTVVGKAFARIWPLDRADWFKK